MFNTKKVNALNQAIITKWLTDQCSRLVFLIQSNNQRHGVHSLSFFCRMCQLNALLSRIFSCNVSSRTQNYYFSPAPCQPVLVGHPNCSQEGGQAYLSRRNGETKDDLYTFNIISTENSAYFILYGSKSTSLFIVPLFVPLSTEIGLILIYVFWHFHSHPMFRLHSPSPILRVRPQTENHEARPFASSTWHGPHRFIHSFLHFRRFVKTSIRNLLLHRSSILFSPSATFPHRSADTSICLFPVGASERPPRHWEPMNQLSRGLGMIKKHGSGWKCVGQCVPLGYRPSGHHSWVYVLCSWLIRCLLYCRFGVFRSDRSDSKCASRLLICRATFERMTWIMI